jgi:hypothetical protein
MSLFRDASFNPMENGQYFNFMNDCTKALNTVFHLNVSIYKDGSGNAFALDNSGNNIENKLITNISYSYPYINSETEEYVDGFMILTFNDETFFIYYDVSHDTNREWYSIQGMDELGIKQFT